MGPRSIARGGSPPDRGLSLQHPTRVGTGGISLDVEKTAGSPFRWWAALSLARVPKIAGGAEEERSKGRTRE